MSRFETAIFGVQTLPASLHCSFIHRLDFHRTHTHTHTHTHTQSI